MQIRVIEDLRRSRLTVLFRLFLAIPHFIWLGLWTIGVLFVAFVAWIVVLVRGQLPDGLHRFFTMYLRYSTHVNAYFNLAANPFPGFLGEDGYEVDVEFDRPQPQNRLKAAFRLLLGVPALLMAAVLGGGAGGSVANASTTYGIQLAGVVSACAFLLWFYALATGRAAEGLVRLQWYGLHYTAQVSAYLLFVTDRYPNSDPRVTGVPWPPAEHPIKLRDAGDDGKRNRMTVFFRLALATPHLVWLALWSVGALAAALVNWILTWIRGQSPDALHRFFAAYIRYQTHVFAFLFMVANPFPGFVGKQGSYPVDLEIGRATKQRRLSVVFRLFAAIPAAIVNGALGSALLVVGILGWFAALFSGRMPAGLRHLGTLALRYAGQTNAYAIGLLTDRYPYAGPPAGTQVLPPATAPPS